MKEEPATKAGNEQPTAFVENFISFLENGDLSDVTIWLIHEAGSEGEDEEEIEKGTKNVVGNVLAHRVILSSASLYFHSMFTSSWQEAANRDINVSLEQFRPTTREAEKEAAPPSSIKSADIFMAVLRFIYGEDIEIDESNVLFYLHAAERFAINSLRKKCMKWLRMHTSADNVFHICQNATAMRLLDAQGAPPRYFI